MAFKRANRVRVTTTTAGTGDISLSQSGGVDTAVSGYQTLAQAGFTNGDQGIFVITHADQYEVSRCTYYQTERVFVSAGTTGGTFTITYNGEVSLAILWNSSASIVKQRLEALSTITSTVIVSGTGSVTDPWVIYFQGSTGIDPTQLTAQLGNLNPGGETVTDQEGPKILTRDIVMESRSSSNADDDKVNFVAGSKDVFLAVPASDYNQYDEGIVKRACKEFYESESTDEASGVKGDRVLIGYFPDDFAIGDTITIRGIYELDVPTGGRSVADNTSTAREAILLDEFDSLRVGSLIPVGNPITDTLYLVIGGIVGAYEATIVYGNLQSFTGLQETESKEKIQTIGNVFQIKKTGASGSGNESFTSVNLNTISINGLTNNPFSVGDHVRVYSRYSIPYNRLVPLKDAYEIFLGSDEGSFRSDITVSSATSTSMTISSAGSALVQNANDLSVRDIYITSHVVAESRVSKLNLINLSDEDFILSVCLPTANMGANNEAVESYHKRYRHISRYSFIISSFGKYFFRCERLYGNRDMQSVYSRNSDRSIDDYGSGLSKVELNSRHPFKMVVAVQSQSQVTSGTFTRQGVYLSDDLTPTEDIWPFWTTSPSINSQTSFIISANERFSAFNYDTDTNGIGPYTVNWQYLQASDDGSGGRTLSWHDLTLNNTTNNVRDFKDSGTGKVVSWDIPDNWEYIDTESLTTNLGVSIIDLRGYIVRAFTNLGYTTRPEIENVSIKPEQTQYVDVTFNNAEDTAFIEAKDKVASSVPSVKDVVINTTTTGIVKTARHTYNKIIASPPVAFATWLGNSTYYDTGITLPAGINSGLGFVSVDIGGESSPGIINFIVDLSTLTSETASTVGGTPSTLVGEIKTIGTTNVFVNFGLTSARKLLYSMNNVAARPRTISIRLPRYEGLSDVSLTVTDDNKDTGKLTITLNKTYV